MRYSEAQELTSRFIEGDTSVDIYYVARLMWVDVNEVAFKDNTRYAYCDVTRVIEVSKDLPESMKELIVAQCLQKFV